MDEYVKCLLTGSNTYITAGRTYRVVEKIGDWISIINDDGVEESYFAHRFIEQTQTQEKENNMYKDQNARTMVQNRSYIVGSFDANGNFSVAACPSGHSTEEKAKDEAKRLARLNSEKTFIVMHIKSGFKNMQIQEI